MKKIEVDGLTEKNGLYFIVCQCGKEFKSKFRMSAIMVAERGSCRSCKKDYRCSKDSDYEIYKRDDGRWCSICSGCGNEQAYTRRNHARQSSLSNWQCKKCVGKAKFFSNNKPIGDRKRLFNRFKKCAASRGLFWDLTEDQMYKNYNGKCAMTGWELKMNWGNDTASLDRIDNLKGYTEDNIQWVHSMVNMAKNKYPIGDFVSMCKAIASHYTGI